MNCVGLAKSSPRGPYQSSTVLKFTYGYLRVKHAWKNVESLHGPLNILHRTVLVYRMYSL